MHRSYSEKFVYDAGSAGALARRSAARCCAAAVSAGRRPFGGSTINEACRCVSPRSNQCCGGDCPPPTWPNGTLGFSKSKSALSCSKTASGLRLTLGELGVGQNVARAERFGAL